MEQRELTEKVLITEEQIGARVRELAVDIAADTPAGQPLVILSILKGSFHFVSDLSRALHPLDVRVDFMQVSSYHEGTQSSGVVRVKKDHEIDIEGRHVLVVEDIVDTGLTLSTLLRILETRRPASIRVAALLIKPEAVMHQAPVDYVGFAIENRFVVGYGLDHNEQHRALPYIAVLAPPGDSDAETARCLSS